MPAVNALANQAAAGGSVYGDLVHIVHVYVVEPHPSLPDLSPYTGKNAQNNISCPQARTVDERAVQACVMSDSLLGEQLMLVDDLGGEWSDNAVWCSYGPAPNLAYLIDQTGVVRVAQLWADAPALGEAIDRLLGE